MILLKRSLLLKSSFALVGVGAYILVFINIPLVYTKFIAIFFLSIIMILNVLGAKKVGKVQLIIVILSLIGLSSLLFLGLPLINSENLSPFLTEGTYGLMSTVAFVYISYAGVTKIAAVAGEVKNPSKNIPRGMHAHFKTKQYLIAVNGSCRVTLDDGHEKTTYNLNRPYIGLLQNEMTWGSMHDFSYDCFYVRDNQTKC